MNSDIKPDSKKLLSNNFVKLFIPLLGYKDVEEEYDSLIQFYRNTKNVIFTIGYSSAPPTPEKSDNPKLPKHNCQTNHYNK
jgi:hypothetical protein